MDKQRQDAWTKDEDTLLAEIVLRHIRHGKTQLEAFAQAASALSRTAAACGFRWNASLRKQYEDAIDLAKNARLDKKSELVHAVDENGYQTIDETISMLEKMRSFVAKEKNQVDAATLKRMHHLQSENRRLKAEIKRYQEAWKEMNHLWSWIKNSNEH